MKIKKTVSEKVLAANQTNGRKTTGPKNCRWNKMNAVTHGLLAKRLLLNEDEAKEFELLRASLEAEYEPETTSECMMVDDLAVLRWKLQSAQTLEMRRLKYREKSAEIVFQTIAAECEVDKLSKLTRDDDLLRGARVGWECTELNITSSNRTFAEESSEHEQTQGNILVQAKVNTGIETIVRYEKSLRNDFYRAMDVLRRLQGKNGITGAASGGPKGTEE